MSMCSFAIDYRVAATGNRRVRKENLDEELSTWEAVEALIEWFDQLWKPR